MTTPSQQNTLPLTVVIPVKNEAPSLGALLEGLAAQQPPAQAVIVVDASSTDETPTLLAAFAARVTWLQVIRVDRAYPGEGRNIGTAAALTDWVAYMDGGTVPHPGVLAALWAGVERQPDCDAVYGFYIPHLTSRTARWFALADLPSSRPVGGGLMRNHVIPSSLVRKAAWKRIGGFPPYRAAEDRVFKDALRQGPIAEAPGAVITWIGPQTWQEVWRRTTLLGEHSARAGRSRDWHWPTARLWGAGLLLACITPFPWNGAALILAVIARAWRRLRRHRYESPLCDRTWHDLPGVAAMLVVMDVALFVGWARKVSQRHDPGAPPSSADRDGP